MKMQALRNGVKSLRSDVSTPCWVETGEAGRIGAAEGIIGRVIFADFSSRTPGKIYRKNSDSPLVVPKNLKIGSPMPVLNFTILRMGLRIKALTKPWIRFGAKLSRH